MMSGRCVGEGSIGSVRFGLLSCAGVTEVLGGEAHRSLLPPNFFYLFIYFILFFNFWS